MAERAPLAAILQAETSFGVGAEFPAGDREHAVMDDPRWREIKLLSGLKPTARRQLAHRGAGITLPIW